MLQNLFSESLANIGLVPVIILSVIVVWSIVWKGIALWVAVKEHNKLWFIVLLIVNTAGILEIVYLLLFSKTGEDYIATLRKKRAMSVQNKNTDVNTV